MSRPVLRRGAKGADVLHLQQRLNAHGDALGEDGDFGGATMRAVKDFQLEEGLVVDGIVGAGTWAELGEEPGDDVELAVPMSWREALMHQQASQSWVREAQRDMLAAIPKDAEPGQKAAVVWMVGIYGMLEDLGANLGTALTPAFIEPYKAYWGIKGTRGMFWCAMVAWAAQLEALGGDYTQKKDWKSLCPIGHWWGSAYDTCRVAKERGIWVPSSKLASAAPGARITGAILVKKNRTGSDAAADRGGKSWPGHVDLATAWTSSGVILASGANLGDTAKPVEQSVSRYFGAVLFPLPLLAHHSTFSRS